MFGSDVGPLWCRGFIRGLERKARKAIERADKATEEAAKEREEVAKEREEAAEQRARAAKDRERADKATEVAVKQRESAGKEREEAAKQRESADKELAETTAKLERLIYKDGENWVCFSDLAQDLEVISSSCGDCFAHPCLASLRPEKGNMKLPDTKDLGRSDVGHIFATDVFGTKKAGSASASAYCPTCTRSV